MKFVGNICNVDLIFFFNIWKPRHVYTADKFVLNHALQWTYLPTSSAPLGDQLADLYPWGGIEYCTLGQIVRSRRMELKSSE